MYVKQGNNNLDPSEDPLKYKTENEYKIFTMLVCAEFKKALIPAECKFLQYM